MAGACQLSLGIHICLTKKRLVDSHSCFSPGGIYDMAPVVSSRVESTSVVKQ